MVDLNQFEDLIFVELRTHTHHELYMYNQLISRGSFIHKNGEYWIPQNFPAMWFVCVCVRERGKGGVKERGE